MTILNLSSILLLVKFISKLNLSLINRLSWTLKGSFWGRNAFTLKLFIVLFERLKRMLILFCSCWAKSLFLTLQRTGNCSFYFLFSKNVNKSYKKSITIFSTYLLSISIPPKILAIRILKKTLITTHLKIRILPNKTKNNKTERN